MTQGSILTLLMQGLASKRQNASVIAISTSSEDAQEMTTLFEQTFRNKQYMTFISKSYLSTLDSISKLQYVESQIAYAKTHRSILLCNIKDTHIPSIHTTTTNKQMMLTQCLTEIKDYQGKSIFLQIFPPVNNMVEAHVLNNNLSLALQWEKTQLNK
jgi:hypothetical protein